MLASDRGHTLCAHAKNIDITSKSTCFQVLFFLYKIVYRTHPVGCIIFAALDLAGQVDTSSLP